MSSISTKNPYDIKIHARFQTRPMGLSLHNFHSFKQSTKVVRNEGFMDIQFAYLLGSNKDRLPKACKACLPSECPHLVNSKELPVVVPHQDF